jgi:hypothetical protein
VKLFISAAWVTIGISPIYALGQTAPAPQPSSGKTPVFFMPEMTAGTTGEQQIEDALARCDASGGGIVTIPSSVGSAAWKRGTIPGKCLIWDLRYHALDIFTDQVTNQRGHSAGLGVFVGEDIPTVNPLIANPVGIYASMQMRTPKIDAWGINYVVNARVQAAAVGLEGDLGVFVPEDFNYAKDQMKFVGGSPNPASTVIRVGGAHGAHRTGFRLDGVSSVWMGNIPENVSSCLPSGTQGYGCLGTYPPWFATAAREITPSVAPEEVLSSTRINGLAGNWMWASCGTGTSQEDIYATTVSDNSFSASFSKPHSSGTICSWYGALAGIDLGNSYFKAAPIILGNLYGTQHYGFPHYPSISVYDGTSRPGSETLRDVLLFDSTSHVILRSLGAGIRAEDETGGDLVNIDEIGNMSARGDIAGSSVVSSRGTPTSSSEECTKGQMWSDENYIYVCVNKNRIKRVSLTSF